MKKQNQDIDEVSDNWQKKIWGHCIMYRALRISQYNVWKQAIDYDMSK